MTDNETINYYTQNCLCRIAVPFYFVSAGFFLFNKINLNNIDYSRIKNYCFKILRLLGTWTVLLLLGSKTQLWYLGSLVVAVLAIVFLFSKKVHFYVIAIITIFLYFIGLLGDSYFG